MPRIVRSRPFQPPVRRAAQSGFSLIEIIIVTVIIGAIVAFAASRVLGGGDKAKYNIAKSQVTTLGQNVESYRMDTGKLPQSLNDLLKAPGGVDGWLGPYAKEADLKDPWGAPMEYRVPGEGRPFDLRSLGADGQAGGDSVKADIVYE